MAPLTFRSCPYKSFFTLVLQEKKAFLTLFVQSFSSTCVLHQLHQLEVGRTLRFLAEFGITYFKSFIF